MHKVGQPAQDAFFGKKQAICSPENDVLWPLRGGNSFLTIN